MLIDSVRWMSQSRLGVVVGADRMGGERIDGGMALGERCEGMPLRDVGGEGDDRFGSDSN